MGSFKLRLVTYFLLLSLLPLLAASWAFSEVASRGERGNADSRLNAALRVAIDDYKQMVEQDAADTADALAHATTVKQAFADRNRAALIRVARDLPTVGFYWNDRLVAGEAPSPLMAETLTKVIRELPREANVVELFNELAGADPLPGR